MEDSELEIKNIEDKVATNTGNIATNAADIATYHPGTVMCIFWFRSDIKTETQIGRYFRPIPKPHFKGKN